MKTKLFITVLSLAIVVAFLIISWYVLKKRPKIQLNIKGFVLGLLIYFGFKYLLPSTATYIMLQIPGFNHISDTIVKTGIIDSILLSCLMISGYLIISRLFFKKGLNKNDLFSLGFGCIVIDICATINNLATSIIYFYKINQGTMDSYLLQTYESINRVQIAEMVSFYEGLLPEYLIFVGISVALHISNQFLLVNIIKRFLECNKKKVLVQIFIIMFIYFIIHMLLPQINLMIAIICTVVYTALQCYCIRKMNYVM